MKNLLVIVIALAFAAPCLAQTAQPPQPPKPGPEVQKLAYFLGTWKAEADVKESAFGPGGKYAGTGTCEWFTGGFHVVCRGEGTGPAGKMADLEILAYDPEAKVYTYYGIASTGESFTSKGSLAGSTWTWVMEGKAAGKPFTYRETMVQVSPTSYTIKGESSVAGGPWTLVEQGKATKIK